MASSSRVWPPPCPSPASGRGHAVAPVALTCDSPALHRGGNVVASFFVKLPTRFDQSHLALPRAEVGLADGLVVGKRRGGVGADNVTVIEQVAAVGDREPLLGVLLHQEHADA